MTGKNLVISLAIWVVAAANFAVGHPAPSAHPDGEWLKDSALSIPMLNGLCLPGFMGGTGELIGFEPCSSQHDSKLDNCAWFNGWDDEGGEHFLTNPVEVIGLNAVLYDDVCTGGDHCQPAVTNGRSMLFSPKYTSDIFLWKGRSEPRKLIRCEDVTY